MKLVYRGPVKECGFTGPVTGAVHVARPGQPFEVNAQDGAALLARYPGLLAEVPTSRPKRKEPAHVEEPIDGTVENTDAAGS